MSAREAALRANLTDNAATMLESKDEVLGCGAVLAFVIGGLWWLCYSFIYAPRHRDNAPPAELVKTDTVQHTSSSLGKPDEAVQAALADVFPSAAPRLDYLAGSNLDIYVSRRDFEGIPFPDREAATKKIADAWCSHVEHTYLPVVRVRDIRTGDLFAKCSCSTGTASVETLPRQ
jgi:hypothetical protein